MNIHKLMLLLNVQKKSFILNILSEKISKIQNLFLKHNQYNQ